MLVCVSVAVYWFLVVTGPAPVVVGNTRGYLDRAACEYDHFRYERGVFSTREIPWWRSDR